MFEFVLFLGVGGNYYIQALTNWLNLHKIDGIAIVYKFIVLKHIYKLDKWGWNDWEKNSEGGIILTLPVIPKEIQTHSPF